MPRTREQLDQAAAEAEAWLDTLEPDELEAPDSTADLRRIAVNLGQLADAENELRDAVVAARANGRSWGRISLVLGVSKQAARQRFGAAAEATT